MANCIPIEVKKNCVEMYNDRVPINKIYNEYFKPLFEKPMCYSSFRGQMSLWRKKTFPDNMTLRNGTYEGFVAHGATVQVSKNGEIVQAWIKQKADEIDLNEFFEGVKEHVKPFDYKIHSFDESFRMLEIPLFDMHWGLAFEDYYEPVLRSIVYLITQHKWEKIVIPFGQDFFHNDSIVNGVTTKGTQIEKVDMQRAVKDGKRFMYTIIDEAIRNADEVKVIYSPGNHDKSISWMFMQVLLERYGNEIIDDSFDARKVVTYGKNAIMITHGDSKKSTPGNLAHIFPVEFPTEFSKTNIREIHAGHIHHEREADIYGVMVRRLSSGSVDGEWATNEGYVGTHKRFMIFEWGIDSLKSIHYI